MTRAATMSGGEKARLALALIAWDKPNLLVLDEPTNHLDMATREALTMALSTFEGTLLLVSHDRHLLRTCCDKLVLVHEGHVGEYDGDLDDYAELVLAHRKSVLEAEKAQRSETSDPGVNRKEQRRFEAQERARIAALKKPLLAKLAKIEKRMATLNEELSVYDMKIADTNWYNTADPTEVALTMKNRGEIAADIEAIELQWLEVSEQIESIV